MSYCSWSSAERFLTTATTATRKIVIFFLSLSLPDRWLLHVRLFYNCTREWNEKNTAFTRNFWRYLNADAVGVAMCVGFLFFFFFIQHSVQTDTPPHTTRIKSTHSCVYTNARMTHISQLLRRRTTYIVRNVSVKTRCTLEFPILHLYRRSVLFVFDFFSRLSRRKNNIAPTVLL